MSQRMAEKVVAMRCEAHDALAPDAQLIELAAVTVQHGRITDKPFHALLDPQTPIPRSVTRWSTATAAPLWLAAPFGVMWPPAGCRTCEARNCWCGMQTFM